MSCGVPWQGIGDATVQVPGTRAVHEAAGDVPGARLVLDVLHLQVRPDFVVLVEAERWHRHGDHARVDAELKVRAVATETKHLS